jgi:hypothetical protein
VTHLGSLTFRGPVRAVAKCVTSAEADLVYFSFDSRHCRAGLSHAAPEGTGSQLRQRLIGGDEFCAEGLQFGDGAFSIFGFQGFDCIFYY